MISQFRSFDEFVKRAQGIGISSDLNALLTLDIIFYEEYEDYLIVSLVDFDSQPNKVMIISEKECLVYPEIINAKHSLYTAPQKAKGVFRESTVTTFLALKKLLGNYTSYYEKLNRQVEHSAQTLDLDEIEEVERHLKKFSDVVHSFETLLIEFEESTLKFVDVELIGYDYDLLLAKTTHLSELCKGLKGEISITRDKTEARSSKELNKRIEHLSEVVRTLTAVTILFMIPTIISSHFGMNFQNTLINWASPYGELTSLMTSAFFMLVAYFIMKKKKWL